MTSENILKSLPETLLRPPAHAWDGPQPGLNAQADELCRYYFSQKTGRLESIVQYDDAGTPAMRVRYRARDDKPQPFEIEQWTGKDFVSRGIINQDGRVIQSHSLPRVMVTEDGEERAIPVDEQGVYITPAGTVVKLVSQGTWLSRPRASYLGRVREFNPLRPFQVKTLAGQHELAVDRHDVVIDLQGYVFEFTTKGLSALGELVIPELAGTVEPEEILEIPHTLFTLHINSTQVKPQESVRMDIHDYHANALVNGPLHSVVGRHPFIHKTIPELVDVHGSLVAEQHLRSVERVALELGLVFYALQHEERTQVRAAFLKAQQGLEERLWNAIATFEQSLSVERHTVISVADIRAWIDFASTDPHGAILELKERAQQKYAAR